MGRGRVNIIDYTPIVISEEDRLRGERLAAEYNRKLEKRFKRTEAVKGVLKYTFLTPLAIASHIISILLKLIGTVTAIGLPYGLYCVYEVICKLCDGIELSEIPQRDFVCLFVFTPFIAFLLSGLTEKIADFRDFHRD